MVSCTQLSSVRASVPREMFRGKSILEYLFELWGLRWGELLVWLLVVLQNQNLTLVLLLVNIDLWKLLVFAKLWPVVWAVCGLIAVSYTVFSITVFCSHIYYYSGKSYPTIITKFDCDFFSFFYRNYCFVNIFLTHLLGVYSTYSLSSCFELCLSSLVIDMKWDVSFSSEPEGVWRKNH